ncbi:hypothetical protein ACEQ8H_004521 [Pleosporales sp. CAS-2024a]
MKRKFSFNLAPVKIPPKHDTKPTPEPTPASARAHPRAQLLQPSPSHTKLLFKDGVCDNSPFIHRRPLDAHTERELRTACKQLLHHGKPSDHALHDADPKPDPPAHHKPQVRMPTGAPVELKTALDARRLRQTDLTLRPPADAAAPVQANSSRRRADADSRDLPTDTREANLRKSSSIRRKDGAAAAADAAAAQWMFQNRVQQEPPQPRAKAPTAPRPPSRTRSIRDNIIEYVFPGTTSQALTRAPSHDSLRTLNTTRSQDSSLEPPSSAPGLGWRGWALPGRRSSSRSNSRPATSKGQSDQAEQLKRTTVNLNRELPPLPSLNSWEQHAEKPPSEKPIQSPTSATHIASVMRPHDAATPEATAVNNNNNKAHRRSGSDTLALPYGAASATRSSIHSKHAVRSASRSKTLTPDSFAPTASTRIASVSTTNLGHVRHKSDDSFATPKKSADTMNFSHKMSIDTPTRSTFSAQGKASRKEEQKSRLIKVFSGWMSKKDKKDDWMDRIEKEGVKEGVLVQDGAAGAHVVRY